MIVAIWAFSRVGVVEIVMSVIMGAVIYFAVRFLLRGFNKRGDSVFPKGVLRYGKAARLKTIKSR